MCVDLCSQRECECSADSAVVIKYSARERRHHSATDWPLFPLPLGLNFYNGNKSKINGRSYKVNNGRNVGEIVFSLVTGGVNFTGLIQKSLGFFFFVASPTF